MGKRTTVTGRVLDGDGRPVRDSLIEVWQANAAGRTSTRATAIRRPWTPTSPAPGGVSPTATAATSSSPQARRVPWGNHDNAWRPAHIHFSLFGPAFATRLITQTVLPRRPPAQYDPIFQSVRDPKAQRRLISSFDLGTTEPEWALGYNFDIVLRAATRRRWRTTGEPEPRAQLGEREPTPSQTIGPLPPLLSFPTPKASASWPTTTPTRCASSASSSTDKISPSGRPRRDRQANRAAATRTRRTAGKTSPRRRLHGLRPLTRRTPTAATSPRRSSRGPSWLDGTWQAPHISFTIFARGLLKPLVTRIYFPDEEEANAADAVLNSVEDPAARSALIGRSLDGALGFDIRLQGDRQTPFFDV